MSKITRHRSPPGALLLGLVFAILPFAAAQAAGSVAPRQVAHQRINQPLNAADIPPSLLNKPVEVFVRMDTPPVAEYVHQAMAAGQGKPSKADQRARARKIKNEQSGVVSTLKAMGAPAVHTLQVGANGVLARVKLRYIAQLEQLPGVVNITRVYPQKPTLFRSVPWIGAPAVWSKFGDGKGVTIGIIDTGIDYTHADFGGSGDPADYAANNPNVIEPGTFPTAKVIGGFDFAGPTYDASATDPALTVPHPDPDPLDGAGHGTHVSGIAAGEGVPGKIGPGVAKGALLYAFKVFGDNGGSTTLTSEAIERALDPNNDGSIDDHVDVINMSLGLDFSGPDDPSAIESENAAKLGVIVAAAAGNAGDIPYVAGAPAAAPDAISVAASVPGGSVLALQVNSPASVAGKYEAVEAAFTPTLATTGARTGSLVPSVPQDGCAPPTNGGDIAGNLALIERGTCAFTAKILNAENAGAIGVVVYNNVAGAPIIMGKAEDDHTVVTVPAEMITLNAGTKLANAISGGASVNATMGPDIKTGTRFGDTLADFSSRGPGQGGSLFKPDITAPGVAIVSAAVGTGDGSVAESGTSMATPHIAGVAALLRPIFPDLSPMDIKAIMQNSAVTANSGGEGTDTPYPLARQGTGVVRADRAANLTSFAEPGGLSFGRVNPSFFGIVTRDFTVHNLSDHWRNFHVSHVPNQTVAGVKVSLLGRSSVRVPPHGTREVHLMLRMDPGKAPVDDDSFSQTEVDGWFMLNDGTDKLRVGYLAVVDPASFVLVRPRGDDKLTFFNLGRSAGLADGFTLAGKDGQIAGDSPVSIRALGYRTSDFGGTPVVEFGLSTDQPWETFSSRIVQIFIDTDKDGVDDIELDAADGSLFDQPTLTGTIITAQFDLATGAGILDWIVSAGDYNDGVITLPFTRAAGGGMVPDSFNYTVVVSDFGNDVDIEQGAVDFADEIVPQMARFGLQSFKHATVTTNGVTGRMLWLFQNNEARRQAQIVNIRARGH